MSGMQLGEALREGIERLKAADVGSPRMNAETLMKFTLGCDRAYLYAHPERQLTAEELERYQTAIGERAAGKPSQYIIGHQEFWGLDFLVTPAVLIPRPETEHVIEMVLDLVREQDTRVPRIVDVGTGSGCIALALAHELPDARMEANDISAAAVEIARANAARLNLDRRVRFHHGDLLEGIPESERFDFIVSNPPYVPRSEPEKVQKQVFEHEPHSAVFGGDTGMQVYERLVPQARAYLKDGGWLVMEIGFSQLEQVQELLGGWAEARVKEDLQGIPRVVAARK
jgi:release factor glutamine methyltransferase